MTLALFWQFWRDLFLSPWALLSLLVLPLILWFYRRQRSDKASVSLAFPLLALLGQVSVRRRWTRSIAPLLFALALALALISLARPSFPVPEAHPQAGIVLALDVSRSMFAQDILPNRFEAAREAIRSFVVDLPAGTRVALVTFAGYATTLVPLTDDHERILEALDYLRTDFGTVIGEAMLESVRALPSLAERLNLGEEPERFATVILLTDGRSFGGIDPLLALEEVKAAHVKIHTIGVGTHDAFIPGIPPQYQFAARFDEETLRTVAEDTGGEFSFVSSASALSEVYQDLGRSLIWRFRREEATALLALGAACVLVLSLTVAAWQRPL
jgi:Ca-activated chloride channel family protein